MDRTQRVDEKSGVIFLIIMFTPGVKVIKMSKMGHFLYFFSDDSKTAIQKITKTDPFVTIEARNLRAPERHFLSENGMVNRFWS